MQALERDYLRHLGAGESIKAICARAGWSRADFDSRWKQELDSRVPKNDGQFKVTVKSNVTVERDRFGIPHVFAENDHDLWFGFGFAMAQDRLFQMDYLRRKGMGRLAEILGADGLPSDVVARTVGLNRIALVERSQLPESTQTLLQAFSEGVNAWIDQASQRLPIEFALLDYAPEPWTPVDCLAIENEFRWYLTGRFPVIVMPELAKRVLGDGPLYRDLLLGEADEEAIIPPEAYRALSAELGTDAWSSFDRKPREDVGQATGDPEGTGSNNWVVAGKHCLSGKPMLASDPHIAFEAVSCWYEVHLSGGSYNVAGMAYVGMPAILCGRNEHVAWGITNNICSQRDLYQEREDPAHPNCFLFDEKWEPVRELEETIFVKGKEPVTRQIRFSRNGPIVDEILPVPGDKTGPVSLKWLGAYHGGWLTALLSLNQARDVAQAREALRPWHVPTFNLVLADDSGRIAVQSAGRIPLRKSAERGYRPGWDPEHQWVGLVPCDAMPHAVDPPRGWLATANNRLAANDYPYPLFGTWPAGYRAARIREMIEARLNKPERERASFSFNDFREMQNDVVSLRAQVCLPLLRAAVASPDEQLSPKSAAQHQSALQHLANWDGRIEADSVAAALFNVFFSLWTKAVVDNYFEGTAAELIANQAQGAACRLLDSDPHGWFKNGQRILAIRRAFAQTLEYLDQRLGPDVDSWQWGSLHPMPLKHVLSNRGDLGKLLDHGGGPVKGDGYTVCNTGGGPDWQANLGAGYRLIVDLATNVLLAVDAQSQSGHPGSPHYSDQLPGWNSGEYHTIPLSHGDASKCVVHKCDLLPRL